MYGRAALRNEHWQVVSDGTPLAQNAGGGLAKKNVWKDGVMCDRKKTTGWNAGKEEKQL